MAIPASVIFIWSGTHASIPAGWSRETTLDSKYIKGPATGVDPDVTGGTTTHAHTGTTHLHLLTNHTHSIAITGITGNTAYNAGDLRQNATDHDSHAGTPYTSGARVEGGLTSVASTYTAFSNDPPYHEVIFIKPDAPVNGVEDDGICFVDSSDVLGFTFCDGSNDTPDLRNKYLKGAEALGDAGGTGGTTTNTHVLTHTHNTSNHTHISVVSGAANRYSQASAGGSGYVWHGHTHTIGLETVSPGALTAGNPSLVCAETVEPSYEKMLPVQNKTGAVLGPVGIIGMWLGTLANIPSGWSEVPRMRGKYLKCANTVTEIGTTGGANTHTHIAQNHTHTSSTTHTHTASGMGHVTYINRTGSTNSATPSTAVHTYTVDSKTAIYDNTATSADSQSNEPEYRTTLFIKLTNIISGGSFIYSLL